MRQEEFPVDLIERNKSLPIDSGKIILIPGVRRCGKSSRMDLVINKLLSEGISRQQILWIGFDDERLVNTPADELHDIIEAYRELFPEIDFKKVYIFFDEIQLIKEWEYFVLKLFKRYTPNIFISGSNATMLSSEMNSALRGWPLEELTYPLSFREYCRFKNIDADSWLEQDQAKIRNAFLEYNSEGGFPEVVLLDNQIMKMKVLQSYFDIMLLRDIAEHYKISNIEGLRYFIKRIFSTQTKPVSIRSLHNDMKSQGLKVSKDDLYDWCEHAQSVFLISKLQQYSDSFQKSERSLPKYYCIDNGLRDAVLLPRSGDEGKKLENIVYLHLLRNLSVNEKLFYYKGQKECDFVVQSDTKITKLIQVCWDLSDDETRSREIEGLREAAGETGCRNLVIVTADSEEDINEQEDLTIKVIPAWKFLLDR